MFVHTDRLPTGPALPNGVRTAVPWGLRRMAPYPAQERGYATATLDPKTQTTVYLDEQGKIVEMGAHGTSTGTNPSTNTGNPSDGQSGGGDQDTGNDGDQ